MIRSTSREGNSPDCKLKSLSIFSVNEVYLLYIDRDVGLEAAII